MDAHRRMNALHQAVDQGNLPTVQWILQQPGGVIVNEGRALDGSMALHMAVSRRHLSIVQAIVQAPGVNLNARDRWGNTPLIKALVVLLSTPPNSQSLPIVHALLEAGADPNAASDDGFSALLFSVGLDNVDVIEAMLNRGADPEARDSENDTPIHFACRCGRFEVVQSMVRHCGPNSGCLTANNEDGETPLDCLRHSRLQQEELVRAHRFILQTYSQPLVQRHGPLCVHSVLRDAVFTDGDDEEFQLPVGKLSTEQLQILLENLIVAEPGSLHALDNEGLLPLQVASQLNFPDLVINVLLRPYPGALLQL